MLSKLASIAGRIAEVLFCLFAILYFLVLLIPNAIAENRSREPYRPRQ